MRVVLVVPPEIGSTDEERFEYLGVGYVASFARAAGFQVDILDCKGQGLSHHDAVVQIQALQPRVVGITAPFYLDLTSGVELSGLLRAAGFDGVIVAGGHTPTFSYQPLLRQYTDIDVVVRGEGEVTFVELLRCIASNGTWSEVSGIAFRDHGEVVVTSPRPLIDNLDLLPMPARDNTGTNGESFSATWFRERGITPGAALLSSRGCPFRCTYCSVQAFYRTSSGRPWRPRSVQSVIDEMDELSERWKIRSFRFSDDNFLGSCKSGKDRAEELALRLIARSAPFRFFIECRAADVDARLFGLLRRAGLGRVNLGFESGVDAMLARFNKRSSAELNKRAIATLKALAIDFAPNFILVDPETSLHELHENLSFIRDTRLYLNPSALQYLYRNRLALFEGTEARNKYVARGQTMPWRFHTLTTEEEAITNQLAAILDFREADPQVAAAFSSIQPAIAELSREDRALDVLLRGLESGNQSLVPAAFRTSLELDSLPVRISRWRTKARTLAFRCFERAVSMAESHTLVCGNVASYSAAFLRDVADFWNQYFNFTANDLASTLGRE